MLTEIFDGCGIAILTYSRSVNVIAAANDDNDHLYGDHDCGEAIMMFSFGIELHGFFTLTAAANY